MSAVWVSFGIVYRVCLGRNFQVLFGVVDGAKLSLVEQGKPSTRAHRVDLGGPMGIIVEECVGVAKTLS